MKKTEIGLISAIVVIVAVFAFSSYSQSKELECLRLYKEWSDYEDYVALQLGNMEAHLDRAYILANYVEKGCPEFRQMDFLYRIANDTITAMEP
ncbi:MAG: hypothetical protein PVG23_06205 [Nitrosopumilaceae archaeon]